MEPSRLNSVQMDEGEDEEDLCLELLSEGAGDPLAMDTGINLLSAQVTMGPLDVEAGRGLLSTHTGGNSLSTGAEMDRLCSQADLEPLSTETGMGLFSLQAGVSILTAHSDMNLLTSHSDMEPLTDLGASGSTGGLPETNAAGSGDYCMELETRGSPVLTQSERERLKTQDSLSILGDPDSLELSKAQVEEFYSHKHPELSGPSTSFSEEQCQWFSEATSDTVDPDRDRAGGTLQFENGTGKEHDSSEHGMELDGEVDRARGGQSPDEALLITDVRALPGRELDGQEEVNMARGGELPDEGSLSSRSLTTKPRAASNEEHAGTNDTTVIENSPTQHKRDGVTGQDSSNDVQLVEDDSAGDVVEVSKDVTSDPLSGLRRSSRTVKPILPSVPPAPAPSRPPSSARQPPHRAGAPPAEQPDAYSSFTCANCCESLKSGQTAYQRRGLPQLFCSSVCLSTFGRKPPRKNPCAHCRSDMTNNKNATMAQIGQSFHEFCSAVCLAQYEAGAQAPPPCDPPPHSRRCSVCGQAREIIHEVSTGNTVHLLCSNACFNTFRASKGLKTNCCDACGSYINMAACRPEYLLHDGVQRRFCNSSCVKLYKMKNTKVLSCLWCKTLSQKFDMLSNVDPSGKIQYFCSTCCITSYKVKTSVNTVPQYPCIICKKNLRQPSYFCKENKTVFAFCSPGCWVKFQSHNPDGVIHLNCQSCYDMFTWKPEVLEWQNSMYQFCSKDCCRTYKSVTGVITVCAQCKQEKIYHKKMTFSGVEKTFCSNACGTLYKQDVTRQLGGVSVDCSYCSQTCIPTVTDQQGDKKWAFCALDCKRKYLRLHLNMSFCHLCQRQGKLQDSLLWKGELRHFCNHHCLLYFCSQHNQPSLQAPHSQPSLQGLSSGTKLSPAASRKSEPPVRLRSVPRSEPAAMASPAPPPTPHPTSLKNKSSMCKPMVETIAITCKPEMKTQGCQTDDFLLTPPLVLPIPVPVYVPLPLHMYCQYSPFSLAWPLPLPVPVFLPSTLDQIVETIKELKLNLPYEPADITAEEEAEEEAGITAEEEADITAEEEAGITAEEEAEEEAGITAEVEAEEEADITAEEEAGITADEEAEEEAEVDEEAEGEADEGAESEVDAEAEGEAESEAEGEADEEADEEAEGESHDAEQEDDLAPAPTPLSRSDHVPLTSDLDEEQDMQSEPGPAEPLLSDPGGVSAGDVGAGGCGSDIPEGPGVIGLKGSKRQALSEGVLQDPLDSQDPGPGLDSSCGVQAWRAWVESQHSDQTKESCAGLKEDILSCSPAELSQGLVQFIQDSASPRGRFKPDSLFYLCLGIQQFLLENNRMVNIFTDQLYSSFARQLDGVLSGWAPQLNTHGVAVSRVVEEHLWECKQLGVYSPFVLLNTLMFFNTKFFHLRTVEQHLQLSFDNVIRRIKKGPAAVKLASICYRPRTRYKKHTGRECSLGKRKREEEEELEQEENRMNPLRCPVKFFEFYLSKCPSAVLDSSTSIYLLPERSCTVDSSLWYSETPMTRGMLGVLLNRILAVRDVPGERTGQRDVD